jgi:hypothetical protein
MLRWDCFGLQYLSLKLLKKMKVGKLQKIEIYATESKQARNAGDRLLRLNVRVIILFSESHKKAEFSQEKMSSLFQREMRVFLLSFSPARSLRLFLLAVQLRELFLVLFLFLLIALNSSLVV